MPRKQVTSRDVAELAGVSRTTVSFVLNDVPNVKISEETRQRVLRAAQELDYYPAAAARTLASGKTRRIGVILGEGQERLMADAFWPMFLQGVITAARQQDYLLVLQMAEDVLSREDYVTLIRQQQVDGLILSSPRTEDPLLATLTDEEFPLVIHGTLPDTPFPTIDVDNQAGAHQAVRHLIGLGHEKIAFVSNAPLRYTSAQDRLTGYRKALTEQGIPYDPAFIQTASFLPETGQAAMQTLLDISPQPTAVFIAGDILALGALRAIHEAGLRVPEDMAVVGFDDLFVAAYAHPPLTSVQVPAYSLGWTAAEVLISHIEGDQDVSSVILETELIIRESCGALNQIPPGT